MARLHFDLRHVADQTGLQISVGMDTYPLQTHSEATLLQARQAHPVLAALPQEAQQAFTHFADLDPAHLKADTVRYLHVTRTPAPGVHLGEVVLMSMLLPEGHLRTYYRNRLQFYRGKKKAWLRTMHRANLKNRPKLHSAKLAALGLAALPKDDESAVELLVQSQSLVTPLDTAAALVSHHPDLANMQPYTSTVILHDHILPDPEVDPDQYNAMQLLAKAIADPNSQPWSPVVPCKDQNGNPLTAGYALDDFTPGQQLYTYSLSDSVLQTVNPATGGTRRTASDDMRLQNKAWSPTPGTTALVQDPGATATNARLTAGDPTFKWTVKERTDHHGVSVDSGSISVDSKDNFSINAANSYLRTLYVGYQLYDDAGKPMGDKELLFSISAVNTLMGIPMPTDPTPLQFNLNGAASVQLYFGSLGTTDWDADVSSRGALLTGLWQYGVPIVFLIAGKALTSTSTFNKIVNDKDLTAIAVAIGLPIVGGGVATAAALTNTKKVLFSFADVVLGLVLQKGMEKLGTWLVEQAGKGAIAKAFGPVGWVMQLAAVAMNVEEMAVTTGEVLSSPANITVTVSRALDVSLTLHPDPRHGEAGKPETAVWPSVAQKYLVTLQYKDGTNYQLTGEMPATTSNTPLPLTFTDVPAGGQFRILAGLYSANGWLAGSWQSDWLEAVPNQGTTLQLGDQNITENLVPLAGDTQYVYKEKVVAKGGDFVWQAGDPPPSATLTSLNCPGSANLCELVDITINNSGFQVGYAWRASGQNLHPDSASAPTSNAQLYAVQNLSVLADPGSRLKTTAIGFTNRPAVGYAPSTNATDEIDQTNFILDPRGGGMNLRQVVLDNGQTDFGLGDPNLKSWGRFPLENVDALAVHPSNAVIAASWQDHKLMVLSLPTAPTDDANAPVALPVSGQGIRQGLTQGPKALAIAPDGRILVLESLNRRVQAFDLKGNPVPSFTPVGILAKLPTAQIAASLDGGQVPEAFQSMLQTTGYTFMFNLDASYAAELDGGKFQPQSDPLITALSQQGVILAYDPEAMSDPAQSAQITVVQKGQSWIITDPRGMAYQVLLQSGSLWVYQRPTQVEVRVEQQGQQWLIIDRGSSNAWRLMPSPADPTQTEVKVALSFFPLRGVRVGSITYLDMAVEAQGYVYVLSYMNDGSKPTDYLLDIYGPDGTFVCRTPDPSVTKSPQNVVAGKIAVDIWRNLYALTYEPMQGVSTPQPGLAHWNPTPPLFDLDLKLQPDFNQMNIGVVSQAFSSHGITLSSQAFIQVENPDGAWAVKDGTTIYHVYRSGDGLQVYAVPA